MINSQPDSLNKEKTTIVVDKSLQYLMMITGEGPSNVLETVKVAPFINEIKYKTIEYNTEQLKNKQKVTDLINFCNRTGLNKFSVAVFNEAKKQIQALLANLGFAVVDIYGIRVGEKLYGYDHGFKLEFVNCEVYLDFCFIHSSRGKNVLGFSYKTSDVVEIFDYKSSTGFYKGTSYFVNMNNYKPEFLYDLIPDFDRTKVSYLSNFNMVVTNLYSSLHPNSFRLYEFSGGQLAPIVAGSLIDSKSIATKTRTLGASIMKSVATNPVSSAGLSNVATAKILSGDVLEKLGDMLLVETVDNGVLKSEADYIIKKFEFIKSKFANEKLQYELCWNASNSMYALGACKTINDEKLRDICGYLISQQFSESNVNAHTVYDSNSTLIGYLKAGDQQIIYDRLNEQEADNKLLSLVVEDDLVSKSEALSAATDILNVDRTRKELEEKKELYESKVAAINLDEIRHEIKKIDSLVSRNFQALSSLASSSDTLAARAATILKQVELILKMPLKTAFSGIEFGCMAEFFDIKTNIDGNSVVNIITDKFVPYWPEVFENQCGTKWSIRNPDPGQGYDNDILIGQVYSQTVNDLAGNNLGGEEKKYQISRRQTRGSGKCEQEVVKETFVADKRLVLKLNDALSRIKQILTTLLNDEIMKALGQVKICVENLTSAVKRYSELRIPYQKKLIEYFTAQEQLFFCIHSLNLIKKFENYEGSFESHSNLNYKHSELNNEWPSTDIQLVNRETRLINVVDKSLEKVPELDYDQDSKALLNSIRTVKDIISKYSEQKVDEWNKSEAENAKNQLQKTEGESDEAFEERKKQKYNEVYNTTKNKNIIRKAESFKLITKIDQVNDETSLNENIFKPSESINSADILKLYFCDQNDENKNQTTLKKFNEQCGFIKTKESIIVEKMKKMRDKILALADKITVKIMEKDDIVINVRENNGSGEFKIEREGFIVAYSYNSEIEDKNGRTILKLTINPKELEYKSDAKQIPPVYVGSLCYSVELLLKHNYIFNSIPFHYGILNKIKYCLFSRTNVTDEETYSKIKSLYGNAIASYFTYYTSKTATLESLMSSLIFSATSNLQLFATTIMAFQDSTLGLMLSTNGLNLGNASSFADEVMKLCL